MNKQVYLFALIFSVLLQLLPNCLVGQGYIIKYDFQTRGDINDSLVDSGIKTIYWNDGLLTLGYAYDSSITRIGTTIAFNDTLGNLLWKKVYFHPTSDILQGNDIFAFDNQHFYIVGINESDSINILDPYFAKFDQSGDSIFFKYYPDVGYNYPLHALPLSGDSILVLSAWKDSTYALYSRNKVWMIDTNASETELFFSSPNMKFSYQLIKYGNHFFIGGNRRTSPTSSFHLKVFIDVLDSTFNYSNTINPSTAINEYFHHFFIFRRNLYLGREVQVTTFNDRLKIDRFNSTSSLSHMNLIGGYWQYLSWGKSISINDTALIIPKYFMNKFYFFIADKNLDSLTQFKVIHQNGGWLRNYSGILPNSYKVYGTGGFKKTSTLSQDHYFFLTQNVLKRLPLTAPNYEPPKAENNTALFPNPFINRVGFLGLKENRMYEVSILAENGQRVFNAYIYPSEKLSLNHLPSGIYTFLLNGNGQIIRLKGNKIN